MRDLFWLSDVACAAMEPHLPPNQPGKPRVDDRRVISGILHILKQVGAGAMCRPNTDQPKLFTIATPVGRAVAFPADDERPRRTDLDSEAEAQVFQSGNYEPTRTVVDRIGADETRQVNARFSAIVSHYLFESEVCNPVSGGEKGQIEKSVQDARRRLW